MVISWEQKRAIPYCVRKLLGDEKCLDNEVFSKEMKFQKFATERNIRIQKRAIRVPTL